MKILLNSNHTNMKQLIIPILALLFSLNTFAQKREYISEKIKAQKVAFITERLNLTSEEAQKFWPIYNAHETEMQMLRHNSREKHRRINFETLSEEEAKTRLTELMAYEKEEQRLKADLVNNLLTAIPAKKILMLQQAEWSFKKRMLDEMRKRKKEFRKKTP